MTPTREQVEEWKRAASATGDTTELSGDALDAALALAFAAGQSSGGAPTWTDGAPPKPWSGEWFIAETTYGDRVVLTELPNEYAYDFKTADDTYLMADKVARWMQFPDSEYKDFAAIVTSVGSGKQFVLEMENTKNDAERAALWPRLRAALLAGDAAREDAERWRTLPALEADYQLDLMRIYRDIDKARGGK